MSIKVETLKAGDVLYDVHTYKMGNTTMTAEGCWEVCVREVGEDERGPWALLAWNGNAPRHKTYHTTKYKRWPKEWIRGGFGGRRCHICGAHEKDGHRETCEHPRAISKRKRSEREVKADAR